MHQYRYCEKTVCCAGSAPFYSFVLILLPRFCCDCFKAELPVPVPAMQKKIGLLSPARSGSRLFCMLKSLRLLFFTRFRYISLKKRVMSTGTGTPSNERFLFTGFRYIVLKTRSIGTGTGTPLDDVFYLVGSDVFLSIEEFFKIIYLLGSDILCLKTCRQYQYRHSS
jgi:hypothetical protein